MSEYDVNPGDRVGALLSIDGNEVSVIGFGIYEGNEVPPMGSNGSIQRLLHISEKENPKIVLDSGEIVWGFECWWASEESVKNLISSTEMRVRYVKREGDNWIPGD